MFGRRLKRSVFCYFTHSLTIRDIVYNLSLNLYICNGQNGVCFVEELALLYMYIYHVLYRMKYSKVTDRPNFP